ncbi:related to zinc finger protein SFP1 [Rhynchosporium secalis]|uniref:Related to zinc finger protein SFP1 n=1 Tax=Rhynchosporium secalis TaxID=38038 RepID=A0A1E1MDH9_RHYSE|nr:related to zinc finger protein SFP1 [Rhynchosporium secalis]
MGLNDWLAKYTSANKDAPEREAAPLAASPPTLEETRNSSNSNASSPFSNNQPATPENENLESDSFKMQTTSPIDIATPTRNASSSPSSQVKPTTNFPDTDSRTSAMMSSNAFENGMGRGRQDSFAGAKPISMNNPNRNADGRPRRESLAGSLVQGMSWGGVSVGSWIRDDIIMAGTSPFPYQSPSYHSSSYLPKLEANFMKDFACCGQTLPTLHDLLQHYEEAHAQQTPQSLRTASAAARARENSVPNSKAAIAAQAASAVQHQAQQQQSQTLQPPRAPGLQLPQGGLSVGGIQLMRQQQQSQPSTPVQKSMQPTLEDLEGVEDMEMDDDMGPLDNAPDTPVQMYQQPHMAQQSLFGQQPRPTLNLNSNGMQHSGLRTSQPTTPATAGFGFQNNPTVSSVNTPTLSALPTQQQSQQFSPDTSVPGTPAGEMEDSFANMPLNLNSMNLNMNMNMNMNMANMNYPFGMGSDALSVDLCIDEPAKRLYSPNGHTQQRLQQQFAQFGLGQGRFGNNEELMRAYRNQQMMAVTNMPQSGMMMGEEHKPFRCPVIGCEKAYKNQNGLKYHKTHGHQTQQLHENGDGTFSIVNPETSAPYPGTLGMEKEKPYKCDVCGKRYKNLNGLKYHKQHSPPCNPDLKLNSHMAAAGLGPLGMNAPGLPGIGEEGMM